VDNSFQCADANLSFSPSILFLATVTNKDVSAFWRELPHAVLTALPVGKLLKLPNNAPVLGLRDLGSSLYLRDVYDLAYQKIKAKLTSAHRKGILVLGTPGSGQRVAGCTCY
jgi:hypothetical protein